MLCQHSEVFLPNETNHIIPAAFIINTVADEAVGRRLVAETIVASTGFPGSLGHDLTADEVRAAVHTAEEYTLAAVLRAIFAALGAKVGARIVGDKSQNDFSHFGILFQTQLLPNGCKIIHLVRDVRDVMSSLSRCTWHTGRRGNTKVANSWATMNANLHTLCKDEPSYHLLRYEDLLEQPEKMLAAVCAFLGVGFEEQMLRYELLGLGLNHLRHHANLGKPLLADRRFAWRNDPERAELAVELSPSYSIVDEALTLFGYEPRSATAEGAD